MISKSPLYNLQAVVKETNLKPDVLRAWERRYGLPNPQRTAGGHRLYSDYDIAIIKWLHSRQEEGLSISSAVELWKEISDTGRDPLAEGYAQPQELPLPEAAEAWAGVAYNRIEIYRANWLSACLAFDAMQAEDLINQAFALYPVETVCFEILQKGINEIGHLWYEGRATVQQEHFATALAVRRIETLISVTPKPVREASVLAGCPEGEWHSFPVLLLSLLLRRKGFNVIYLGANIPLEQMVTNVNSIHPNLVVLAAQQLSSAAAIRSAAAAFHKEGIPMAYGGLIFNRIPELRGRIPAYFLGEDLQDAVFRIERLLANPASFQHGIPVAEGDARFAAIFQSKLPAIESALMDLLNEEGIALENFREINTYFSSEISAALELGDLSLLEPDFDWLKRLMADRKIPEEMLHPYLAALRKAVIQEMGESGALITGWLASYLARS